MNKYSAKDILNLAVLGHGGAGKTSLCEAMLYLAGVSERRGKIPEGNTISDCDPEEIKRKSSISTASLPFQWKNKKVNLIDAPGLFDFEGGTLEASRAADTALIVLAGKSGVCVGTEKAMKLAQKNNLSKIIFVNGLCDEGSDFYGVFEELKSSFGPSICPIVVPFFEDGKADKYINMLEYKAYDYSEGKPVQIPMPDMGTRLEGLRTAIYEAVAETDESLFEKYFSGEEFTPTEIIMGIHNGVKSGSITPVFCGDALLMRGMEQFMDGIAWLCPNAEEKDGELAINDKGEEVIIDINKDEKTSAIVFKTIIDAFVGKLSFVKVISGKITSDSTLINSRTKNTEKIGKTYMLCGKKQIEVDYITAGDIGAIPKLNDTKTGDTLCSSSKPVTLARIDYPIPSLEMAILPKNKGDEDKISQGILRLCEEDPTIEFYTNHETHQMIVKGLGEQHIDVIISRLKSRFSVDVILEKPKTAYRETIKKSVKVQGRYKKQTGGHGQFGDVWIEFSPSDCDGLEFSEKVVGGAVPKGFFPAVEKGLSEAILKGTLAGYPVVGLKAVLYDGSYHPVDSSEMAFKMAAISAFKNGIPDAQPVLLEPVGKLTATIPDENMGDIMGEVNKRRGRVLGMNSVDGEQVVEAEVPMSEMSDFNTYMRQATQGRGNYTFDFERYEELASQLAQKVIDEAMK